MVAATVVALSSASIVPPAWAADRQPPTGMVAGIAVYDRITERFLYRSDAAKQFRSASLVKLLIALDHAWELGPDYVIPADDRAKLELMLRSSDDAAASEFWARNGRGLIVERMVARLGLRHTTPPPPDHSGWGSTGLSAEDVVRIYRYILDAAPAPVRNLMMRNLHESTRCGTDGFDQSFGIRSAFTTRSAVKQGWVNFGDSPRHPCTSEAAVGARRAATNEPEPIDYGSVALHTTGTVGRHDRTIVVVLSTHRPGTSYAQAGFALTNLTRSLPVPGAVPAPRLPRPEPGLWFGTWSSEVPVRAAATNSSTQVGTVPSRQEVRVSCQIQGEEVVRGNTRNDWWTYLPDLGGYMSNIFFEYPDNRLADVPVCT
ncbi:hypothetical protein ACFFX1_16050 [Dactylosporangium sucinum]|uniref:Lipoprotein n=1 Tax=Dactylosporangium sucinum TaxID=1424081 RepID=A0A917WTR6_9ACTN|nr:hypothetical protein [Dactylosporangium sucinum]GGM27282.1 hypothetical protein GCM10007977_030590 [Dactylosporangium sucinum]